jgi:hypothetical protein
MTFVRLVVVDRVFRLESRDARVVAPSLDAAAARTDEVVFTLRRPDGTRHEARGRIEPVHLHVRDPHRAAATFVAHVVLAGLAPEDVPPGTEVWAPVEHGDSAPV